MSIATKNYKTWVEVSKKTLLDNVQIVRGLLKPDTRLMAVVKSNAYGHGLIETAKLFCGSPSTKLGATPSQSADWLGVDNIDEAILLRKKGIKAPIMVMGYTPAERLSEAVKHDLRLTIYDLEIPRYISTIYNLKPNTYNLHLKIDTGMSRQGVTLADLSSFLKSLSRNVNIEGVYTHFANADNLIDRSHPNFQLANFKKAIVALNRRKVNPKMLHASATTGLLTMPGAHFDMVRAGVALYGLWPSSEFRDKFKNLKIKPALSWKTRVVQIKKIKNGASVGYGITEKVRKDSVIAILPVGYYDGYFRKLSSASEVLIGEQRCKILGRISMNLSVVDISDVKNPKVWDEVVLIGGQKRLPDKTQSKEQITAEELAEKADTISYEVVSRINPVLPRIYI